MRDDHAHLLDKNQRKRSPKSIDALRCGDRLRLRDYIFEVVYTEPIDKEGKTDAARDLICICDKRFARVIHDRLAVYNKKGADLPDGEVISLAQYTEYRQWSASVDLYSIGALCLYCLCSARLIPTATAERKEGDAGADEGPSSSAPAGEVDRPADPSQGTAASSKGASQKDVGAVLERAYRLLDSRLGRAKELLVRNKIGVQVEG